MQDTILSGFQLSPQQKRLWLLQHNNSNYRARCAVLLEGELQIERLTNAVQQVVDRHEILRTVFLRQPGMKFPLQVISDRVQPSWRCIDLSTSLEREAQIDKIFRAEGELPFDAERGPILRLSLLTLSEDKHILLLSMPLLCADVRTLKNLVREVSYFYDGNFQNGELGDPPVQYADVSEWQNELLDIEDVDEQTRKAYWRKQNLSSLPVLTLPFAAKSDERAVFEAECQVLAITSELVGRVEAIARQYNTSHSAVLLACWQTLLWRLTGQSDVVVGNIYDGRDNEEFHDAIGTFAKSLPIYCQMEDSLSFAKVLSRVHKSTNEAYRWHNYLLSEDSAESIEKAENCSISFEFEERFSKHCVKGVTFSIYKQSSHIDRTHLKLSCVHRDNCWNAEFYYAPHLFQQEDIRRIADYFENLLQSSVRDPEASIDALEILSESEREQLLTAFNQTTADYPQDKCIHHLFEAQVKVAPNHVAIAIEDRQLTYAELNARANQLARHLKTLGVGPEVLVGIYTERSLDMVVGILGVLKAGGAYVPIDPAYPQERCAFVLRDTQVPVLLTQNRLLEKLPAHNAQVVCLDTDWQSILQQSQADLLSETSAINLAYLIYTSGTTGNPKGVMVTHANLCHYVRALRVPLNVTAADIYLHTASLAFSSSVRQLMIPLSVGSTVVIATSEQRKDPLALFDVIKRHSVTIMDIVPSYWRSCIQSLTELESRKTLLDNNLRLILSASEALWSDVPKAWTSELEHEARFINMYGQTETTGIVAVFPIPTTSDNKVKVIPLGQPIANTQIYLLDRHLQPVPLGTCGELYIGGSGLARGYFNQPELTATRFISNPFSKDSEARLYKTGDLARYLPDGNIEFLCRSDNQVKIRGHRIEMGEIEATLVQHPAVREAVVIDREDLPGDRRLVAYFTADRKLELTVGELHGILKQKLPEYMIPSAFVLLDTLPLTPNGKIDRRALPDPGRVRLEKGDFVAPRTPVEEIMSAIWAELLGIQQVGIHDNFFELGGNSLLATQLVSRIRKTFQVNLPLRSLFEAATVAELSQAAIANETKPGQTEKIARVLKKIQNMSAEDARETVQKMREKNISA